MYQMIQKCTIWKVFAEFTKDPEKSFQVRELSRGINLAPTSINIHLKELEKDKLIKKEKVGVYYGYKANLDNDNFRFYKKIMNIISI